jgi:REP element-mobilizing transposase RayT
MPYWGDSKTALAVQQILLECAQRHAFLLHAYCLMPDHLHFLAQGTEDRCNLLELVRLFKPRPALAFRDPVANNFGKRAFTTMYFVPQIPSNKSRHTSGATRCAALWLASGISLLGLADDPADKNASLEHPLGHTTEIKIVTLKAA